MKRIWIILAVIAAVCVASYLYLHIRKSKDFEPQIKKKLAELVKKASNGLYKLDMESVEIDVTNFSVTAENVLLSPDSLRVIQLAEAKQLNDNIYTISLKKLSIHGLSPFDLIKGNDIDIKQITLDSPDIKIYHKKRESFIKDTGNLYSKIVPAHKSWKLGNLLLQNIHLTVQNADKQNKLSVFKDLTASFTDIRIDSTTKNDTTRFLFARDAVLFIKGYSFTTVNKLYHLSVDSIAVKPQHDSLSAFGIHYKPVGTKDAFSKKLPYLKDRYDIYAKNVFVKNIHWFDLLAGEGFYGDEMKIRNGYMDVYEDLRLPKGPKKKTGTFPQQLLMKLGIPISIPKINISDFKVSYEEFNPASDRLGSVTFNRLEGEIYHFSNIPEVIRHSPLIKINATCRLMNAGLLKTTFIFDMQHASEGNFTADATLGTMDGPAINPTAESLGLFSIKSGTVDQLDTHITGSNTRAEGTLTFMYHDLRVEFFRKNGEGDIKGRGLTSFLANNLVLRKSNPAGTNTTRTKNIVTDNAEGNRTFFNLIWANIADGMLRTVKGKYFIDRLIPKLK